MEFEQFANAVFKAVQSIKNGDEFLEPGFIIQWIDEVASLHYGGSSLEIYRKPVELSHLLESCEEMTAYLEDSLVEHGHDG